MKAIMMTLVTLRFWPKRIRGMLDLLAQDGLTGWRVKARVAWFMLGKPGVLRRVFLPWLAFFMPGFHPWNEDDRHLIALNDSDYEAARLPQALAA
jgi:predicted metal-dependent hydrolase